MGHPHVSKPPVVPPGTPHPRGVGTPRHGCALQRRQLRAAGAAHGRGRGRRGRGVGGTRPNLASWDGREHFFRIYGKSPFLMGKSTIYGHLQ